jgi:hypothetical protein
MGVMPSRLPLTTPPSRTILLLRLRSQKMVAKVEPRDYLKPAGGSQLRIECLQIDSLKNGILENF